MRFEPLWGVLGATNDVHIRLIRTLLVLNELFARCYG